MDLRHRCLPGRWNNRSRALTLARKFTTVLDPEIRFAARYSTADGSAGYGGCLNVRPTSCHRVRCSCNRRPSFCRIHPAV